MGCTSSKQDETPAVALCRERCSFLDQAIHHRYTLAAAHVAYMQSLEVIGRSLRNFIEHDYGRFAGSVGEPPSPKLNLPPQKKGDPLEDGPSLPKKAAVSHHSRSDSGHIQFPTDSDDEDSETHSLHDSDHLSPLHSYEGGLTEYGTADYPNYSNYQNMGQEPSSFPGGYMQMNYMRNKATPSVVYEHRPISPEKGRMEIGESSSSSYYPYPSYPNNNPGPSSYPYSGYPNYPNYPNYGNFYNNPPYGSSSPLPSTAVASSSKPPPPPPSPPTSSTWNLDYLNPFAGYDFSLSTPGRNSIDVREAEGIPDLEEDYQHEVVKEVHGDQKFVGSSGYSKSPVDDEDGKVLGGTREVEASLYQTRPTVEMENDGEEYEVPVVEKKVVNDDNAEEHGNGAHSAPWDVSEVAREIEVQFVRASESGNEIAKLLEVGKFPYQRKHVSSKMLHVVTPSLKVVSSSSKTGRPSSSAEDASPAILDLPEEKNLSSTLHKLYLWEKKLYNEVKAEEKMRVVHDAKRKKLKRLDEKGAEPHKVESTRTLIRSLSTKMQIAIEAVDKISVTINKIRDEDLWPQLNELIQGLNKMWKSMLGCHRSQCEAIRGAKNFGSMGSGKKLSDTHLEATMQLEQKLLNWTFQFSSWAVAQRCYVTALNHWLFNCLHYEPESTEDGIVPYSPGRLGAPPVFVICHQWAQALGRISEKEVVDSMRLFAGSVYKLWEEDKKEMCQRMMASKDLERKIRTLDREEQRMKRWIQELDKKLIQVSADVNSLSVSGHVVYQSDTSSSPQGRLQRIFEAMEKFAAESSKVYDELLQRTEDETVAQA